MEIACDLVDPSDVEDILMLGSDPEKTLTLNGFQDRSVSFLRKVYKTIFPTPEHIEPEVRD